MKWENNNFEQICRCLRSLIKISMYIILTQNKRCKLYLLVGTWQLGKRLSYGRMASRFDPDIQPLISYDHMTEPDQEV